MVTARSSLGSAGEDKAVHHLESLGYRIIDRNYRCRYGEIDVIASDAGDLVFVEVKTRRSRSYGSASESVDRRKRQKLALSAQAYLQQNCPGEVSARFDVAEVYFENGRPVSVELIKGAFSAEPR